MAVLQRSVSNISSSNPQPVVGQVLVSSQIPNTTFYSSRLVNYVESIEVDGVMKTAFFSEVNTNLNVGDRVFIVNGNYDSGSLIKDNKYKKFSDGYRVLAINGCRVVLDVDYTGLLPSVDYTSKNFIYVHVVTSQKDFDYVNSLSTSLDGTPFIKSVFSGNIVDGDLVLECQNILYTNGSFQGNQTISGNYGKVSSEGFWVRVDDGVNNDWIDISYYVLSNRIIQNPIFSGSGKLNILGADFSYDGSIFEKGGIYKYDNYEWIISNEDYPSYISKLNFRSGKFRGVHNDGIYGSYKNKLDWSKSVWNSGVLLNANWKDGYMNSKHTVEETSFLCGLQKVGSVETIVQSFDNTDNRGFGYNFIENSNFFTYSIGNGNFFNCTFLTQSQMKSALDIYYGLDTPYLSVSNGGRYEFCDIYDLRGNNSVFVNSSIRNSNLLRSKIVSSETINTSIEKSNWSSDGGIKIIGADLWGYDHGQNAVLSGTQASIFGTIKLYISEEDYFKLSKGDTFYISKLNKEFINNIIDDENKILNILENRYLIENYDDHDISSGNLSKMFVSLKSTQENLYRSYIKTSNTTVNYYKYSINDTDTSAWYKIPAAFAFSSTYAQNIGYILGDFVFVGDPMDINKTLFFQYWPVNKGDVADGRVGSRAFLGDFSKAEQYGENWKQYGPLDSNVPYSGDWLQVGIYNGYILSATMAIWDPSTSYFGFTNQEILLTPNSNYSPAYPYGDIIRDNDIDNNYYIFVGYDIGLTNSSKQILTSVDYLSQNTVTYSNFNYPSIDISSNIFGWYENIDGELVGTSRNRISPIDVTNINNLFKDTILVNGDFKSGVMSDSSWVSGDHTNNYSNVIQKIANQPLDIKLDTYLSKKILVLTLINKNLSSFDLEGYDYRVGDYVWLKSINYTEFTGATVSSVSGRYKIVRFFPLNSEVWLENLDTVNKISNLNSGGTFFINSGDTNNYLSIHKTNFVDSKIVSGKFKRSGIENCKIENENFKKYVYPASDLKNTELLRLVNIMFQDTKNTIKSGLVYKSHFVNDIFDGGNFYNSIWLGGTFSDGLFKSSVWTGGNFNGGKFVDSRESTVFTFDFDVTSNIKLWQGGNFNGGEFYNSLWVRGNFNGGRFYFSDWTGGTWNNGVLGSKNIRTRDTTMAYFGPTTSFGATHTVWYNGLVENATVGGFGSIDWYGGKMSGGEFTSEGRNSSNYSIWHGGDFYSSAFTKQAWWLTGNFYSGKFLSEIGWDQVSLLSHPSATFSYGWVSGNLYGGEFGNGSTGTNSVWYDGIMHGGVFQGKFWRDGLAINGKFYGSLVTQSDISQSLLSYTQSFYGIWNNGYVDNIIYNVKKDRLVTTEDLEVSSKKIKPTLKMFDMYNVVWIKGTFSHELSTFNNSVWLSGEFNSGNFNDSYFNPYVDLTLAGANIEDYVRFEYTKMIYDYVDTLLNDQDFVFETTTFFLQRIIDFKNTLNNDPIIKGEFIVEFAFFDGQVSPYPPNYGDIDFPESDYNNFSANDLNSTVVVRIYEPKIFVRFPNEYVGITLFRPQSPAPPGPGTPIPSLIYTYLYPNLQNSGTLPYSFNTNEVCIWKGGNFNGGEFNYSKWLGGNFNNGVINGSIWLDGVFNYGEMNNCYWENGTWRNGNWNGSPFDYTKLKFDTSSSLWIVDDKKTDQILKNIYNYTSNTNLHLSNVITKEPTTTEVVHTFDASDFVRWKVDTENSTQ